MAKATVYEAACEALPKGILVRGRVLNKYQSPDKKGLYWMKVGIPGTKIHRTILVEHVRQTKNQKRGGN